MAEVLISKPLSRYTGNKRKLQLKGHTVLELLRELADECPDLKDKVIKGSGLSKLVIVYVNGKDIRLLNDEDTVVDDKCEIRLLEALAGG